MADGKLMLVSNDQLFVTGSEKTGSVSLEKESSVGQVFDKESFQNDTRNWSTNQKRVFDSSF